MNLMTKVNIDTSENTNVIYDSSSDFYSNLDGS